MDAKQVQNVTIQVSSRPGRFHAELAKEHYKKCGLKPFSGRGHVGGFQHVYGDGDTVEEAVADCQAALGQFGVTVARIVVENE